jgi:hypothetical protein
MYSIPRNSPSDVNTSVTFLGRTSGSYNSFIYNKGLVSIQPINAPEGGSRTLSAVMHEGYSEKNRRELAHVKCRTTHWLIKKRVTGYLMFVLVSTEWVMCPAIDNHASGKIRSYPLSSC